MPQARDDEGLDDEVQDIEQLEGEEEGDQPTEEGDEPDQPSEGEGSDGDEVQVSIGDEPANAEEDDKTAPPWVREVRKRNRELDRENSDLRKQLAAGAAPKTVVVGPKPTLEACEFDTERFESELTAYFVRKREADDQAAGAQKKAEAAQAAWQATLGGYQKAKASLKVPDADDAEAAAKDVLSTAQQGLILQGAENPALVVYAIGKNPATAKRLAGIEDPVKFAFAVAKLETQLKVTPKKSAPVPERVVRGNASTAGAVGGNDARLAALEAAAEKSGDRTKLVAYKRQLRERSRTS